MPIGVNHTKRKLAANEFMLAMAVNQMRTPNVAMIAAACGFDTIYIDLERNSTSLETAAGICVAALGAGITPIARVTSHDEHDATRILDCAGDYKHPRMRAAFETVAAAAKKHGKSMGVGGVREDLEFQTWPLSIGVRYLTGGSDTGYVLSSGRADVKRLRELKLP